MTSSDGAGAGGNNARRAAARDLVDRTGMKYTAALDLVTPPAEPRQPRARWILTDELRRFFAGHGWHGLHFENMYDWLDGLDVAYECDWCSEDGDATAEDSTIEMVVAGYDPDVSPKTFMLFLKKHHARCRPTGIVWAQPADIPAGPYSVGLPASARPDMAGEFSITARPLLDDDPDTSPVLLLTATVTEDHGQGAAPWLNELEMLLTENGFTRHDDFAAYDDAPDWSLRIVTGYSSTLAPQWLALRMGPPQMGEAPDHFFLGAVDLPEAWVDRARATGRVLVCAGPCTVAGDVPDLPEQWDIAVLDELLDDEWFRVRYVPVADDPDVAVQAGRS